jgi:hypothetical protein
MIEDRIVRVLTDNIPKGIRGPESFKLRWSVCFFFQETGYEPNRKREKGFVLQYFLWLLPCSCLVTERYLEEN